ncbi:uncharacterized protein [Lolium perenne]|uniref:uncharacterized protein n=1 Tax=Lolium perenne TaxID=4522 RepID=UPI0021F65B93|nr:uncharacterized protein LOC127315020 [Lolium perenne]
MDDEELATRDYSRLRKSMHRDGSIYRGMDHYPWKEDYRIADRGETRLEATTMSDPTPDCLFHKDGYCWTHYPTGMLQFFSLRVVKLPADAPGSVVELYGYVAARDNLDPLLNYVVNISRDDPVIVEKGSLIAMSGPRRGIEMLDSSLLEYDVRIKNGVHEEDDLQLLDGASMFQFWDASARPFTLRMPTDSGAIDMIVACINCAVEATVEVFILEVQSSFNLSLICLNGGFIEEMILFDGATAESRGLKRSVVAVASHSYLDLKFNLGALPSSSNQHCCSFKAEIHGHVTQNIKTEFALISLKVTWSTLPFG